MKLSKQKLEYAMALSCMNAYDVADKAGINYQTVRKALVGNQVKPRTVGQIAKALNIDPSEIIAKEN